MQIYCISLNSQEKSCHFLCYFCRCVELFRKQVLMKNTFFYLLLVLNVLLFSCGSEDPENISFESTSENSKMNNEQAEAYVLEIDNAKLMTGNSLYYTRNDGASIEVNLFLNDSSKVLKTVERYTIKEGGSICTNLFYYKNDKKYVTKEIFEEGTGESAVFVERVSYYDSKGKPKITKVRKAPYEDQLEFATFKLTDKKDCSDERAVQVLNQQGPYATNFQFFVQEEHLLYLIVGENDDEGYRSSLVVQQKGQVIQELLANERKMIGKPLVVEFEKVLGDMGFEFQALMGVMYAK